MKTAEPADFQAELQDEFHVAQFMLQACPDRLRQVGELFGPARVKRPTALKEVLLRFRALNEVGQCLINSKDGMDSAKEKFLLLVHKVFTLGEPMIENWELKNGKWLLKRGRAIMEMNNSGKDPTWRNRYREYNILSDKRENIYGKANEEFQTTYFQL